MKLHDLNAHLEADYDFNKDQLKDIIAQYSAHQELFATANKLYRKKNVDKEAVKRYKRSLEILDTEPLNAFAFLDPVRATVTARFAEVSRRNLKKCRAVLRQYEQIQAIYEGDYCKGKIEFDLERARNATNFAKRLHLLGNHSDALEQYQRAQNLYDGVYCKNKIALDLNRARIASSMGSILAYTGRLSDAMKQYRKARAFYSGSFCKSRPKFDRARASIEHELGDLVREMEGDHAKGIEYYHRSKAWLADSYCMNRLDFDPDRAENAWSLGNALADTDDYPAAIKQYRSVQTLCAGDFCKHDSGLNELRVRNARSLAIALRVVGDHSAAVEQYFYSIDLCENHLEDWLSPEKQACLGYADASELMEHMPDCQTWAAATSKRLDEILKEKSRLDSNHRIEENTISIRDDFMRFHYNWLKYCIEMNEQRRIPEILFTVQNRHTGSDLMDKFEPAFPGNSLALVH